MEKIIITEVLYGLLGVFVGGGLTFLGQGLFRRSDEKSNQSHSASMLFHDLKSILNYIEFINENESTTRTCEVNIRYHDDWQSKVASCTFLTDEHIALLYSLYDVVYAYNYAFNKKVSADISRNKSSLTKMMISENIGFLELLEVLEKHIKSRKKSHSI